MDAYLITPLSFFFFCLHLWVWLQICANRSRDAGSYSCSDASRPSPWDGPAQQTKPKYTMNSVVLLVADKHKLHSHLLLHKAEFTPPEHNCQDTSAPRTRTAAEGESWARWCNDSQKCKYWEKVLVSINSCSFFFFFLSSLWCTQDA